MYIDFKGILTSIWIWWARRVIQFKYYGEVRHKDDKDAAVAYIFTDNKKFAEHMMSEEQKEKMKEKEDEL